MAGGGGGGGGDGHGTATAKRTCDVHRRRAVQGSDRKLVDRRLIEIGAFAVEVLQYLRAAGIQ